MYVGLWPCKSSVVAFAQKREITGEPLNSRSQILAPNRREITGVDCMKVIAVNNINWFFLFLTLANEMMTF